MLEYYKEDKDANQVIIFEGVIYKVDEYMPTHPGGGDMIEKLLGMKIDEDFEDAEHTKSARKIFKDLPVIGKIGTAAEKPEGEIEKPKEKIEEKIKEQLAFDGMGGLDTNVSEKLNFNYDKGIIYQIYSHNWTLEEYA